MDHKNQSTPTKGPFFGLPLFGLELSFIAVFFAAAADVFFAVAAAAGFFECFAAAGVFFAACFFGAGFFLGGSESIVIALSFLVVAACPLFNRVFSWRSSPGS